MWPGRLSSAPGRAERGCRASGASRPACPHPPVCPSPRPGVWVGTGCRGTEHRASFLRGRSIEQPQNGPPSRWQGGPSSSGTSASGEAGLLPPTRETAQSACPSKPQGPAGLVSNSPHGQLRACGVSSVPPVPDSTTELGERVHLQDMSLRVRTPSSGPPGSSSRAPWGISVRKWPGVPQALVFTDAQPQATPRAVTCPSKL